MMKRVRRWLMMGLVMAGIGWGGWPVTPTAQPIS